MVKSKFSIVLILFALATSQLTSCSVQSDDKSIEKDTGEQPMAPTSNTVSALKEKYRARIKVGNTGKNYREHAKAMDELLREWDPIGKRLQELMLVAGPPSETEVTYAFESGYMGEAWVFHIRDDKIVSIERQIID